MIFFINSIINKPFNFFQFIFSYNNKLVKIIQKVNTLFLKYKKKKQTYRNQDNFQGQGLSMNQLITKGKDMQNDAIHYVEDQQQEQQKVQGIEFVNDKEQNYEENYDDEFQQLQKSHQKIAKQQKLKKSTIQQKQNKKIVQKVAEKYQTIKSKTNIPSNNQIPSKQNNWNQNKSKQSINGNKNINQSHHEQNKQNMEQMEKDAQDDDFQVIQNQKPQQQSFTLLQNSNKSTIQQQNKFNQKVKTVQSQKQQQQEENQPTKNSKIKIPTQHKQKTKQQLSKQAYQNQKLIKQLKSKIADARNQIKNIGNVVDKDIQKSMTKMNNKNKRLVNIKDFFNENIVKNDHQNQKIFKLRQELKIVRRDCQIAKIQITNIQTRLSDPLSIQNTQKYEQVQNKLRLLTQQTSKFIKQKQLMSQQLKRMKQGLNLQQKQQFNKSIQKNQILLNNVINEIKQQRSKLYKLQKNDIFYMEKLKFFAEKDQKLVQSIIQSQKSIGESKISDQQIRYQINQIVDDINSIMDQRNKTQNQRTRLFKSLQVEIQTYENKNVELLNQIRSIDASLLQFYIHKVHKKNSVSKNPPKTAQKFHQTIDPSSPLLREKEKQLDKFLDKKIQINDKNMVISNSNKFRSKLQAKKQKIKDKTQNTVQTQEFKQNQSQQNNYSKQTFQQPKNQTQLKLNQIKSSLNFGDLKVDQKGAILSDQILGKVKIKQIHIFADSKNCYGVQCKYFSEQKLEIIGMKICQKNADQKCQKISLVFKEHQKQVIENIKIGFSTRNQIKFIQISTNMKNSLKWGNQKETNRIDQKTVGKYSSISIKAKLVSVEEQLQGTTKSLNQILNEKPKLKVAGIGFTVLELKQVN